MLLLFLTLLACVIAPPIYWLGTRNNWGLKAFQFFIALYVVYLTAFHILPDSYFRISYHAILVALAGFLFLTVAELRWNQHRVKISRTSLLLALAGLGIHTLIDGAALVPNALHQIHDQLESTGHTHSHSFLPGSENNLGMAVLLHRLPVCLMIWGFLFPKFGLAKTLGVYGLISIMTIAGFFWGKWLLNLFSDDAFLALFEAFVAGALLHVVAEPWIHKARPRKVSKDNNQQEAA